METVEAVKLEHVVNPELLSSHMANGLVSQTRHPYLPLCIYNYTHLAAHEPHWGDGTIDWCRGLIVDDKSHVIARPFKKFHNLNTASIPETHEANLPKTTPRILEKLDGSLGILWRYESEWGVATRGSFTSPQAKWATDYYKRGLDDGSLKLFPEELYTVLFEIIYDENRIVCKYDVEGLIVLGMVHKPTGTELPYNGVTRMAQDRGFQVARRYELKTLQECLTENEKGREGYVLTYNRPGFDNPPVKVKIKFEDYVRLHKIVTGMNPRSVWELLSAGKDLAELEAMNLPEHFKAWLLHWKVDLCAEFNNIWEAANVHYVNAPIYNAHDKRKYRGAFAAYVKTLPPSFHSIMFAMLDGINPTEIIWKQLKPRGDDKSFRTDGE